MATSTNQAREVKGFNRKVCIIPGRLEGKLAIVTGANTGIGKYTTSELARRGARVVMACRNLERAEEAKKWITERYGAQNPNHITNDLADRCLQDSFSAITPEQLDIEILDLASLNSVREFASRISQKYESLNYLINNAGITIHDYRKTEDGFEETMGVNHLGPFLLTELLLPLLRKGEPSRIIMVSSVWHKYGQLCKPNLDIGAEQYDGLASYCNTKLANVMHARELAKKLKDSKVTAVSVHPGFVQTELFRDKASLKIKFYAISSMFLAIKPWLGCQTTLYTVLTPNLTPGAYYDNCKAIQPHATALDDNECAWLWEKSCELLGLQEKKD